MENESDEWIMHGVEWDNSKCLHSVDEAIKYINKVGFLPLFKHDIVYVKFFNKKAFALECYFRYNSSSISLQKGQTFLPTAKLVDYISRSQPFFSLRAMGAL